MKNNQSLQIHRKKDSNRHRRNEKRKPRACAILLANWVVWLNSWMHRYRYDIDIDIDIYIYINTHCFGAFSSPTYFSYRSFLSPTGSQSPRATLALRNLPGWPQLRCGKSWHRFVASWCFFPGSPKNARVHGCITNKYNIYI